MQKALTLSGTKLLGIPIQVQYTEAEKNRQARDGTGSSGAGGGGSGSAPMTGGCVPLSPSLPPRVRPTADAPRPRRARRLYVGSLNFALTSDDIREVFQPFGELETVELHRDPATGKSKGYCFVKCVPSPLSLSVRERAADAGAVRAGSRSTRTPWSRSRR